MTEIRRKNEAYFKKEMCTRILHSVPYQGIYRGTDRRHYTNSNWHEERAHLQFTMSLQKQDEEDMEVLLWLQN